MRRLFAFIVVALVLCAPSSCIRPAEQRAERDLEIGRGETGGLALSVSDGLAAVLRASDGEIVLWASAPVFEIHLDAKANALGSFAIEIRNCLPDADLVAVSANPKLSVTPFSHDSSTRKRFRVELAPRAKYELRFTTPDAENRGAWRFGVMSDVQEAVDRVGDIYARVNQANVRFLLGAGDLTQFGSSGELEHFKDQMKTLEVPYYTTLGNHELGTNPPAYQDLFGRANFHFSFRGVDFSMLDSGSATLDPLVYDFLDDWLNRGRQSVHVVAMHIPPLDPIGVRNGAFGSRAEAAKLLTRLAEGHVDLTLYGHIHSYYAFDNAGIPARISGGGGAIPERFDGIGRHFLVVNVSADGGIGEIEVVRVDAGD